MKGHSRVQQIFGTMKINQQDMMDQATLFYIITSKELCSIVRLMYLLVHKKGFSLYKVKALCVQSSYLNIVMQLFLQFFGDKLKSNFLATFFCCCQ